MDILKELEQSEVSAESPDARREISRERCNVMAVMQREARIATLERRLPTPKDRSNQAEATRGDIRRRVRALRAGRPTVAEAIREARRVVRMWQSH